MTGTPVVFCDFIMDRTEKSVEGHNRRSPNRVSQADSSAPRGQRVRPDNARVVSASKPRYSLILTVKVEVNVKIDRSRPDLPSMQLWRPWEQGRPLGGDSKIQPVLYSLHSKNRSVRISTHLVCSGLDNRLSVRLAVQSVAVHRTVAD